MAQHFNHKYCFEINENITKDNIPILTILFELNNEYHSMLYIIDNQHKVLQYDTNTKFNDKQIEFINNNIEQFELRELLLISTILYNNAEIDILKLIFNEMKNRIEIANNYKQTFYDFIKLDNNIARFNCEHYFDNDYHPNTSDKYKNNIIIMMTLLKIINYPHIDTIIEQFYVEYINDIIDLFNKLNN